MAQKKRKNRQLRRKVVATLTKLLNPQKVAAEPDAPEPEPKPGDLSFEKPGSRKALRYNPMTAPGETFTDPRRRSYEIGDKGQLRVVSKPRSRVKKRREERAQQEKPKAGGKKA